MESNGTENQKKLDKPEPQQNQSPEDLAVQLQTQPSQMQLEDSDDDVEYVDENVEVKNGSGNDDDNESPLKVRPVPLPSQPSAPVLDLSGKPEPAGDFFERPDPNKLTLFFKYHPKVPAAQNDLPFNSEKAFVRKNKTKRIWLSYSEVRKALFCTGV
ncbi:hypothetical protein PPYR_01876 [Photinus pyralis]|uniref:Uncharacterized protein n=1 Tax=Photinus pyralis TaxID=7054 RepID=A0A5N4B5S3_PHOPY|nr:hypothetical protein PPYR_01876 [Photinus pyralis]